MKRDKVWLFPLVLTLLACRLLAPAQPASPPLQSAASTDLVLAGASLRMQGMQAGCVPVYAGYDVEALVENRGPAAAEDVVVLEESTGRQVQIGHLAAGQRFAVQFPAQAPGGKYVIVVDPQNRVAELDDANNRLEFLAPTPTPPQLCTPAASDSEVTPVAPAASPAGRSIAADALVLSAHQAGENTCYDLAVYGDGRYILNACQPGFTYPKPEGYLDANELLYLYRWSDVLQPFTSTQPSGTLEFTGQGTRPPTPAEMVAVEMLVSNLEFRAHDYVSGGGLPGGALAAQRLLSRQLGVPVEQIQTAGIEPLDFPDGCLGLPLPGESCPPGPFPGLVVKLALAGQIYKFHTDLAGYDLREAGLVQGEGGG